MTDSDGNEFILKHFIPFLCSAPGTYSRTGTKTIRELTEIIRVLTEIGLYFCLTKTIPVTWVLVRTVPASLEYKIVRW